jgi:hypothetical protein
MTSVTLLGTIGRWLGDVLREAALEHHRRLASNNQQPGTGQTSNYQPYTTTLLQHHLVDSALHNRKDKLTYHIS